MPKITKLLQIHLFVTRKKCKVMLFALGHSK